LSLAQPFGVDNFAARIAVDCLVYCVFVILGPTIENENKTVSDFFVQMNPIFMKSVHCIALSYAAAWLVRRGGIGAP
jgi:hypothetical protein